MLSYSFSGDSEPLRDMISRSEFAAGVQLLRGVSLQSTRLQVAVLRREQRPIIEALDLLRDMDRELEQFVQAIGPQAPTSHELDSLNEMIALQKAALDAEKMALMSGVTGHALKGAKKEALDFEDEPSAVEDDVPEGDYEEEQPRRFVAWIAGSLLVLAAGGAAAWYYSDMLIGRIAF